eukprot:2104298-Pyramimonas_sp.AAC.1
MTYAAQNETLPSLRVAICASVATFEGSWEAQRNGDVNTPGEMQFAQPLPLSWAAGKSSGAVSSANQKETSPPLGGWGCRYAHALL